ncbi:MAG: hypothetical protein H7X99_03455 [Saprospiraceae bacterium]|nr:hypothetical protein [Saprospiraceae bacterium]
MKNCMWFILLLSIFACNKEDVTCTDINYNKAFTAEVDKKYCIDDENFILITNIENALCPCDVVCIWEGEFLIHMTVSADGTLHEYILGSSGQIPRTPTFDSFRIKFLSITPDACDSGVQKDYRVGLEIEK